MAKPAASKLVEITVISAEGLLVNRKQPVKKNTYVVVRSDPYNSQSTRTDTEGGSYPSWNQKLLPVEMPPHTRYITVEVYSSSKLVGTATLPVSDFSGGYLPDNYLSFLSYRLRDANGEKNGIVNLSVKVIGSGCAVSCSRPWIGVPADNKVSGGVTMGIPVSYKY